MLPGINDTIQKLGIPLVENQALSFNIITR